jgi:hypothetical protein
MAAASTAVTLAVAAYQAGNAQMAKGPKTPALTDAQAPAQPEVASFDQTQANALRQAQTAGGTLVSDPEKRSQIGADTLTPRKSLLGQ